MSAPLGEPPLRRGTLLGFGLGSIGTGIFSTTPGVLLLYFLTETLRVPAAAAGLAVFLPKAWDVIADPIMGFISDRTRSRFGRRRPYLLAGAIGMSVSYVFLFTVPEFERPMQSFWYVVCVFTLSATAYTVFAIPYVAMPAEMSDRPEQRVRIMSFRMSFVMVGAMIGSAGAPWLVHEFGGGRSAYSTMSIVIGSVCAASMLCAFVATRGVRLEEPKAADVAFGRQLADTLRSRDFRALLAVYLTQILSIGTLIATAPYFASRIMGAGEGLVGAMFLVMMGAGILSIPMWNSLAIRWGKRPSYLLAIALLLASSAALGLLSPESSPLLYPLMAVAGLGFGAQQVLPFAMLTDLIRSRSFGSGREGVTTGIWVAGEKLGLALGPLLAGLILELGGFRAGGSPAASPESLLAIRIGFSVVPAALMLSSGLLLVRLPAEPGTRAR